MRRHPRNPILTREDIPAVSPSLTDVSAVFNPAAVFHQGRCQLLLRIQNRGRETLWMRAQSEDGIRFTVDPHEVRLAGLDRVKGTVYHAYDPRITWIDGAFHILCALDTDRGCFLGLIRSEDLREFRFLGIVSGEEVRNGVLFPRKIGGRYLRLERPNEEALPGGVRSGSAIWLAESDDLTTWRRVAPVLRGRPHYWDERIGSGPPPIRTRAGWLHLYHGVATHFASQNIYQAGVVLLDDEDPSRVIARSRYNILEPRAPYELTGQVPNVVFPSGWIVGAGAGFGDDVVPDDAEIKVYYGAADTVVGLAFTTVGELLSACDPVEEEK